MKTKEFIRMLQEADPEGEGFIRLPDGGAPYAAITKEGYWDGAYQYLEYKDDDVKKRSDAILVTSTQGYKVDICSKCTDDIIWEEEGNMEKIKKRIRYDYTYYDNDERIAQNWKWIEEEAAYARGYHEKSVIDWTKRVIDQFYLGDWIVTQPLDKPIGYYNCMTAIRNTWFFKTVKDTLCQGECMAIIESGKFYPEKTDKYYIWRYDPEKGKDWRIKEE